MKTYEFEFMENSKILFFTCQAHNLELAEYLLRARFIYAEPIAVRITQTKTHVYPVDYERT